MRRNFIMYAIIETGGKQYRVQEGDVLKVEKINAEEGAKVYFNVLAINNGELVTGKPYVENCAVEAEVIGQGKGDKVIIYKYKAKKDYRRKNGHRQPFTEVKITSLGAEAPKSETIKAEATKSEAPAEDVKANINMKKAELLEIAQSKGIEVSNKATKADILAAIEEN